MKQSKKKVVDKSKLSDNKLNDGFADETKETSLLSMRKKNINRKDTQ